MHRLPFPGEDSSYMEDSKAHHNANHQEQKFKYFCPWHPGIGLSKENTMQSSTGWSNGFTYREKRQSKISFRVRARSPKASRSLQAAPAGQFTYKHPSRAPVEELVPSLWRTGVVMGLARYNKMQHLSRTKEHTVNLQ